MGIAFPFTAIVGQEDMKRALMIAAVDPGVGGVLVLGERGTGKSTTIRALAAMLPSIDVVDQCLYQCDPTAPRPGLCAHCGKPSETPASRAVTIPVVDLPLGSTEDRVVGALDIERALVNGEKAFQPGLLAQANRGFLYVDEVNLLEDHIVDALLDVAASGENVVEREGLSIRHPARFVLVGSGNPEEGELRPQLQDRFGLSVDIRTPADVSTRVEIIRQREAFDHDRAAFKGVEHLGGVKAQHTQITMLQQRSTVAIHPEGMGGVVNHLEVVVIGDALDRLYITGEPIAVHWKDRCGARCDAGFDTRGIEAITTLLNVSKHRLEAIPAQRFAGGHKRKRGSDHLPLQPQSLESDQQRQSAIGKQGDVLDAEIGSQLSLKLLV